MSIDITEIKNKISNIMEILPAINSLSGEAIIVHVPFRAILNKKILKELSKEICLIRQFNIDIIVICDSDIQFDKWLRDTFKTKISLKDIDETQRTIIYEAAIKGHLASALTAELSKLGCVSISMSGKDGKLITAKSSSSITLNHSTGMHEISSSLINAEIVDINIDILSQLSETEIIPIIAPIASDSQNENTYIVNSIELASKIAQRLEAQKLILGTSQQGIKDVDGNLITAIGSTEARKLHKKDYDKVLVEQSIQAVTNAVKSSHIINLTDEHSLLIEVFSGQGIGTMIYSDEV